MSIRFFCIRCGKEYRVKDTAAGRRGKCKECGAVIEVPAQAAVDHQRAEPELCAPSRQEQTVSSKSREIACPGCLGSIIVEGDDRARPTQCPHCGKQLPLRRGKAPSSPLHAVASAASDTTPTSTDRTMGRLGCAGLLLVVLAYSFAFPIRWWTGLDVEPLLRLVGCALLFSYGIRVLFVGRLAVVSRKKMVLGLPARLGGLVFVCLALLVFVGGLGRA